MTRDIKTDGQTDIIIAYCQTLYSRSRIGYIAKIANFPVCGLRPPPPQNPRILQTVISIQWKGVHQPTISC